MRTGDRMEMPRSDKPVTHDAGSVHNAILAVVNPGYSEEVIERAKAIGLGLGTPIEARTADRKEARRMLGVSVQAGAGKEMVLILAPDDITAELQAELRRQRGIQSEAGGVLFSMAIKSAGEPG